MAFICRDNPLIHLNYAVLLYNAGDLRAASKHYAHYEKSQKGSVDLSDSEVSVLLGSKGGGGGGGGLADCTI